MELNNKISIIHVKQNIKNNHKQYNISLLKVNDKNSIKEYYNIY